MMIESGAQKGPKRMIAQRSPPIPLVRMRMPRSAQIKQLLKIPAKSPFILGPSCAVTSLLHHVTVQIRSRLWGPWPCTVFKRRNVRAWQRGSSWALTPVWGGQTVTRRCQSLAEDEKSSSNPSEAGGCKYTKLSCFATVVHLSIQKKRLWKQFGDKNVSRFCFWCFQVAFLLYM